VQRGSAVVDRDAVIGSEIRGESILEVLDLRTPPERCMTARPSPARVELWSL
jgi:hypothetical protein